MQAGNLKGNVKKLAEKYEDAKATKDGNIAVKQDGLWYLADANGLGEGNAWDRTKEALKDTLDLADEAALAAASTGAAILTGGSSLLAQGAAFAAAGAASELTRSSFGRLAGTYEASPLEQMEDIATEGLMSGLGGVIFPWLAKPSALP